MDYTPDGKKDELFGLINRFSIFELTTVNYFFGNAPDDWQPQVQDAERAKQCGEYFRSAEILTDLMRDGDAAYTQLSEMLFEIEICSGFIVAGTQRLCGMIQTLEIASLPHLAALYKGKLEDLAASFMSEDSLLTYLSERCGNPNYYLPSEYVGLKAQLESIKESDAYGRHFKDMESDWPSTNRAFSGSTAMDLSSDELVPTSANDDGSFGFHAHKSIPFAPDYKWEEIEQLVTALIHDSDPVAGKKLIRRSAEPYPPEWDSQMRQAAELKRRGQFFASAKIYDDLSRTSGVLYTGIIASLYKSVAASVALLSGNFLLVNGSTIFHQDPKAVAAAAGIPSAFEDHLSRLLDAARSEPGLQSYLRDICGNVNYRLPRDYANAVGELSEHYSNMATQLENLKKVERKNSDGCYIATAVYGSYDAVPVMTLRRFRDESLANSLAGRAFISFYYATSPSIAKRLKHAKLLNYVVRRFLDMVVRKLDARG